MKKILSIVCVIVAIAASSCTKQYITPNPNQSMLINVASSTWTTTDGGKTYQSVINSPEIDNYFNNHGGVLVYFSFTNGVYEREVCRNSKDAAAMWGSSPNPVSQWTAGSLRNHVSWRLANCRVAC